MVIFFDVDGTLVDEATQIIPASLEPALQALRARGHVPVVNTGRPYGNCDPRIRALPFSGWICACGMQVFLEGTQIHRNYPTLEACRHMLDMAKKHRMVAVCEGESAVYFDRHGDLRGSGPREALRMESVGFQSGTLEDAWDRGFVKFVTNDTDCSDRQGFIQAIGADFDPIFREGDMIEFVAKGSSKARGMEILLEKLGVHRADTVAFGDSTNDLPMFALAGTAIAMGNGVPELKEKAHYITDTVLQDGIWKALTRLGLIDATGHE